MDPSPNKLPDRIREFALGLRESRIAAGKTQEQVAKLSKVSRRTIIRWEAGEVSPWIPELLAVLNAIGDSESSRERLLRLLDTKRSFIAGSSAIAAWSAQFLKVARIRAGKTTDEVAELIGRNQSTVARWESGVLCPDPAEFEQLCQRLVILPVELDELALTSACAPSRDAELDERVIGILWPWDPDSYICFDARFAVLLRQLETALKSIQPKWEARARAAYAWMLSSSARYSEAKAESSRALALVQESQDVPAALHCTCQLTQARSDAYANSDRGLTRALRTLDDLEGKPLTWELLARRYDTYAEALSNHGDNARALMYNEQAHAAALRGNANLARLIQFNRARILLGQGEAGAALESIKGFSEMTPRNDAIEYLVLAAIHGSLGNGEQEQHWKRMSESVTDRFFLHRAIPENVSQAWGVPLPIM